MARGGTHGRRIGFGEFGVAQGSQASEAGPEGSRMGKFFQRQRQRRKEQWLEELGVRCRILQRRKRKGQIQEGRQEEQRRKKPRRGAEGSGMEGDSGEASHLGLAVGEDRRIASEENSATVREVHSEVFRASQLLQERGLGAWHELISRADRLETTGCVLAWAIVQAEELGAEGLGAKFMRSIFEQCCEPHGPLPRKRGTIFPLRAGKLELLRTVLKGLTLSQVADPGFSAAWSEDSWLFCVFTGINGLALKPQPVSAGPWTAVEQRAAANAKECIHRFLQMETTASWSADTIAADIAEKRLSYAGEEQSKIHVLTLEQVLPALPPIEHGGCIEIVDFLGEGTRRLLEQPELLLREDDGREFPKLQAKIHCAPSDQLPLAKALVDHNICDWVEMSDVFEVRGEKVLSGLFGVAKSNTLPDGRPTLRLIMNLIPINSLLHTIQGRIRGLPSITSWMAVASNDSEEVVFWQSDMCSAFYLFRVPSIWKRMLCFNLLAKGDSINKDPTKTYALCCQVLPMGWNCSVALMQEAAENLAKMGGLSTEGQVLRGAAVPSFLFEVMAEGEKCLKPWWHVYLDNFCVGQRVRKGQKATSGNELHEAAELSWRRAGILSSEKKRLSGGSRALELGALVEGEGKTISVSGDRFLKLILGSWHVVGSNRIEKKALQILAGRWVHALQFKRAGMCRMEKVWHLVSGKLHGPQLPFQVRRELIGLCLMAPLLHTSLTATVSSFITASDASERGGAVGIARSLTLEGADFTRASRVAAKNVQRIDVLVVSLFNGIGGAFRIYDILGLLPTGGIAFDTFQPANRVTSRRWPYVKIYGDVNQIGPALCKDWAMEFADIAEIHLWAGFPCTDLSSAKAYREGLQGQASGLFYKIPEIVEHLRKAFGPRVRIRKVIENVASMEREACQEINRVLGLFPYYLDCCDAVPMRRPRLCWCDEPLEGALLNIEVVDERHWKRVTATKEYPETSSWLEDGFEWPGRDRGAIFPTAMKAIRRSQPPPRPAGLARCGEDAVARWQADEYRYPPYQYSDDFILWQGNQWRLLDSNERELLLGYGWKHTELCYSASDIKRDRNAYEDTRCSLLGDAFSVYSFVVAGAALCRQFLPKLDYRHLCRRMGMSPGFRAPLRFVAPLRRGLSYGTFGEGFGADDPGSLNRFLLSRVNHTGSDIRISSGDIVSPKAYPRQSVEAMWWNWQILFRVLWDRQEHINSLEMRSILLTVKYYVLNLRAANARIFHITDSYVCMSIIGKGRSSSQKISWTLRQLNALLLLFSLQLVVGHVESTKNPTDGASRA